MLVLPNWAEQNLQPVAREQDALRNAWGYTADEFVVGYSGNIGRAHDTESITALAARLREHVRIHLDGEVARVLHASAAGHSCASGDVQRLCELLHDVGEGDACADAGANGLRYAQANLHRDIALQRWHRALAMLDIHRGGHPGRVMVGVGAAVGNASRQLTSSMPQ